MINSVITRLKARGAAVYASRDWHPRVTSHFREYGGQWPPHCIAESAGAGFHPDLRLPADAVVVTKGDQPGDDGYSPLTGRTGEGKTLLDDLRERRTERLVVGGLATDYCVKHAVLDALGVGLKVVVLEDAIAGVDVQEGDSARAIEEMKRAGAQVLRSDDL